MLDKALGFFRYLLGKTSDLAHLDRNDALLGKIVVDIHRKKTGTEMVFLPLGSILPIHPIDREEALETMHERAAVVAEHRTAIEAQGDISRDFLYEFLPSVSNIKVVDLGDGTTVSFEGNGRLAALKQALGEDSEIPVEVELYRFAPRDQARLRRRIDRVRRGNGLGPLPAS